MLIELGAEVVVTRQDQIRSIIRESGSYSRTRYLEIITRKMALALMNTPGAVEVTEERQPSGDIVMRARCVVEDENRRMPVPGGYSIVDGEAFFMKPEDPITATEAMVQRNNNFTLDALIMAKEALDSPQYNPIAFLEGRMNVAKAKKEAKEQFEAREIGYQEIEKNTKKPGMAMPSVTVKVRKIQMQGGDL